MGCPCNPVKARSSMNCACTADSSSKSASGWKGAPWSGQGYFPTFPASCPYVTALGGTMGPETGERETTAQVRVTPCISEAFAFGLTRSFTD